MEPSAIPTGRSFWEKQYGEYNDTSDRPQTGGYIGKYIEKDEETSFSKYKKGAPVHVKSAINYNSLLEHWFEGRKYEKITNGNKIKWV